MFIHYSVINFLSILEADIAFHFAAKYLQLYHRLNNINIYDNVSFAPNVKGTSLGRLALLCSYFYEYRCVVIDVI